MHPPGERLVSLITHYTRIAYASAIGVRLSSCFGEETLWQRSNWSSTSGSPASTSVGGIGTNNFHVYYPTTYCSGKQDRRSRSQRRLSQC